MFSIDNEEAFNDSNIQMKVPFLKPTFKYVGKIIHFHDTCTCTEDYNVDMDLYGLIWQLVRGRLVSVCPPKVAQPLLFCAACCFYFPLTVDGKNQAREKTGDV